MNFRAHVATAALLAAALLAGCNSSSGGTRENIVDEEPPTVVTGAAIYRERIALPPDHVFEATLEDIPQADAAAKVIGRTVVNLPTPPAHGLRLPASFRGDLSCTDCEGVRHHLDLWPDQVFHLRREWLGKDGDMVRGDMGRWRVDPARRALVLHGGAEMPLQYQILGPDRLRQLDFTGQPILSDLPYELSSDGTLEMAEIPSFFLGHMTYMLDAARFTECLTGRNYPIAPGEEALRLQREYLATVSEPGGKLMVHFEGALKQLPGMENDRLQPTLVVDRFIAVRPKAFCPL